MASNYVNIPSFGSPSWREPVATVLALPTNGNVLGDARIVLSTDVIYIWTGSAWVSSGGGGGGGITALTGDVSAAGSGSVPATVNLVGGATAANVATATAKVLAATPTYAANTLVLRDGGGSFQAINIDAYAFSTAAQRSNSEVFGNGNTVSGPSNTIVGARNTTISGQGNVILGNNVSGISGNQNALIGDGCAVHGTKSYNLLIGQQAQSYGDRNVLIGFNATCAAGDDSTALGAQAYCLAGQSVCIGGQGLINGIGGTAIGFYNTADSYGTALGFAATATGNSISLGSNSFTLGAGQFVAGGVGSPINDVYFGVGINNATVVPYTIHGVGGNGTNIAGSDISIAGGIGTGTGAGGTVNIQAAPAGSTGSTPNALATVASFSAPGVSLSRGLSLFTRTVAAAYAVDTTSPDCIVFANTTAGVFTITLPTPTAGRILYFKDVAGTFGTNALTIAPHAAEKIDGAASKVLNTAYASLELTGNGTDWFSI
jgi:hypothetical protein